MVDLKYSDKKILAEYDLSVDLFDAFDLKVYDASPLRNIFVLATDKGLKVLKKLQYTSEELDYIISLVNYIKVKYDRIMDFVETKEGKKFTFYNGDIYYVMNLIEGHECDFSNPLELELVSKGLGELHNASEGFRYNKLNKNLTGSAINNLKRRQQEMFLFKSIAELHEHKTEFDSTFLDHYNYFMNDIEKSIDLLEKSSYLKLCSEEDKIAVCHHDLAHHNMIINNEGVYFIDFDYSIIDLKVHDLSNLVNKVGKQFAYNIEKIEIILNSYCSTNSLDKRELEVLFAFITFPEDFYNISRDYYTRRKEWEEEVFVDRLNRKVNFKEEKEEFLDEYKKRLL